MQKENNKNMMIVWVLIVLVVVAVLVYITIHNRAKNSVSTGQVGTEQNTNMGTQNAIQVTILKEGTGAVVKAGDTVAVNYTGALADGTVFDSNIDPKFKHVQPFEFPVGGGQVIQGWDTGLVGMKVGEIRRLEIAPEAAYGANGVPGVIPPNSTLVFQVELLGIK